MYILIFIVAAVGFGPRYETVSGRIAAFDQFNICDNGYAHGHVLIHIEKPKKQGAEFAQVPFSIPCGEKPQWILMPAVLQKFHLIRLKEFDAPLEEFIGCEDISAGIAKPCPPSSRWHSIPGQENLKLPFGYIVPWYRSKELPDVPIL